MSSDATISCMQSYNSYRPRPVPPKKRSFKLLFILLFVLAVILVVYLLFFRSSKVGAPENNTQQTDQATTATAEEKQQELPKLDLQPVIDAWVTDHAGTYSIAVLDEEGKVIAKHNDEQVMFTASIYKLYVAYFGYQAVADGTYSMSDPYLSGYTRGECLDEMIRSSYSPCAEKMWAELGKESLTTKLKAYGLTGTSMTGLQTTAHDAAVILHRLQSKQELSEEHTAAFLDSMKTQDAKYRRGLPSGFKTAVAYNKVGWNETIEWHDTAIVEFENGRKLSIAVLTKNVGFKNIANLASAIETAVTE